MSAGETEAAEWIVFQLRYRFRHILEVMAVTLGVVRVDPSFVIEHAPERAAVDHGQIGDDRDQDIPDAFVVKRTCQMMMIDDVITFVRPQHDGDHMLTQGFGLLLLIAFAPTLALFLDLSHSDGHLRRAQRQDRDRLQQRFARVGHHLDTPAG